MRRLRVSRAPAAYRFPAISRAPIRHTSGRESSSAAAGAAAAAAANLTLSEQLVAEHPKLVRESLRKRCASAEQVQAVDRIGVLTRERARQVERGNRLRAERKVLSSKIGRMMKEGECTAALKEQVASASCEAAVSDQQVNSIELERTSLFNMLPNLLDARTPAGVGEDDNVVVDNWRCDALPLGRPWHDEIGPSLGLELEAAAKISGSRFSVLKGQLARLERALVNFFVETHVEKHGYTEVSVPFLVGRDALVGTGQLPKFEEELFRLDAPLNGRESFLIPTAEVPLANLHAGQIVDDSLLPLSYVSATPCFRAEAGSHGQDARGLVRQHQFHKVELVKVTTPAQSDAEHHALVEHAETCLQMLELPYRKVRLCAGDLGFSARLCYDLEVWLPAQGRFREISSCSNCGDFQARRVGLRYRPRPQPGSSRPSKPVFCHTMNGSGLAVGRTLVAILENHQRDGGSIRIPEALRPHLGGAAELKPQP